MKTTPTFVYNVLAAVALLLCSMQGFSQECVSCDNNVIDTLKFSSAIGTENISTGINSFAVGRENQALGDYSIAMPLLARSLGQRSVAIGYLSNANANQSIALGSYSHTSSNATLSIAMGSIVSTQRNYSIVMGFGSDDTLKNSIEKSLMIGINSNLPTFFVGPSEGTGTTGRVGIGNVTSPQAKLHILADENEAADLILEHRTTGNNQVAKFILGTHSIVASANNNMIFTTPTNAQHFHFEKGNIRSENGTELLPAYSFTGSPNTGMFRPSQNTIGFSTGSTERLRITGTGNVGIGTSQPQAKLHVHGDFQVGDTANPQNMRLYGSINATGEYATAFGQGSIASGNYSFVAGRNSIIQQGNNHGFILGSESSINGGFHSIVIGSNSHSTNDFSYVFGPYSKAKGTMAFAIGSHVEAWSGGSFVIGAGMGDAKLINTIPNSLMIGFGSSLPTLFVEKAPFSFEEDLTGRVGIGNVTAPQAKLHIRADENEHATLRLEATGSDKHSSIAFSGEHFISAKENDHLWFNTSQDKAFLFHNGDIFIEDITKGIIMKSPNGQCWRGTLNDQGMLVFAQTDCPDESSAVINQSNTGIPVRIYPNPTGGSITIELPHETTNANWMLTSLDGGSLAGGRITSAKTEISLAHFMAGIYVLSIEQNGRLIASEKVVKQ